MITANISLLPPQASAHAAQVDYLFYFITFLTGAATVLVYILLTVFCVAYRRRGTSDHQTPRILGSHKLEVFWTAIPLILFLVMFGWGVAVYDEAFAAPADAPEIYVVGKQWMWKAQHAETGVREINELHLLVNKPVKLTLISEDVIHSFGVPAFRDKIDTLPNRYVSTWYHPTKAGTYYLFCDQLCGTGHAQMVGQVVVMEPDEYQAWLDGKRATMDGPTDGALAWEGRKLFLKLQCSSCHNNKGRAPILEGIWGTEVPVVENGQRKLVKVDAGYIRESILHPKRKVHEGWEPIMPTFEGQLADEALGLNQEEVLVRLIAFIKTLGPGQTPVRTERFPPPIGAKTELEDSKSGGKSDAKKSGAEEKKAEPEGKKTPDNGGAKSGAEGDEK